MKLKLNERILWISLALILVTTLIFTHSPGIIKAQIPSSSDPNQNLLLFQNIYMKILNEYVDEQKADELIHNAIDGMLKGIKDPHSALLKPQNFTDLKTETQGQYGGLGIVVGVRDDKLTVISPMEDTPAERVGLRAEDRIVKINGTNSIGLPLDKAVEKMRGVPKTPITITIERDGEKNTFDVTIIREVINVKSVKTGMIATNVAYLRITSFSQNTAEQLAKELTQMKASNYSSMIIDLRNNPGGLLDVAIKLCDMFLDNTVIVSTRGRIPYNNQVYAATRGTFVDDSIPMIVLVNKGSASASEIFAGAMQDTKRGLLLGTQTFGKGSVQTVLNLDGGYGLRMTIARYYTPAGQMIDKKGLTPDIAVENILLTQSEIEGISRLSKTNILKAFAKEHPTNYNEEQFAKLQKDLKKINIELRDIVIKTRIKMEQSNKQPLYDLESDNQLNQAVQILKARAVLQRNGKE